MSIAFDPESHPLITVDQETGCWVGAGHDTGKGHTAIACGGSKTLGHVLFFAVFRGIVPRGMVLHHTCENKPCWNPWHLQPISPMDHRAKHTAQRTACPHGHAYPEHAMRDSDGRLRCRICTTERKRNAKARSKANRRWHCSCGAEGGRDQFPLVRPTTPQCASCGRKGGHHIKPIAT